jgi:hypothetical protein
MKEFPQKDLAAYPHTINETFTTNFIHIPFWPSKSNGSQGIDSMFLATLLTWYTSQLARTVRQEARTAGANGATVKS